MSIREVLQIGNSRAVADRVVTMALADEERLVELMVCMFGNDVRLAQRAAHAVGLIGREEPLVLTPWFNDLVNAIEDPIHQSLRRCGVRYFSELKSGIPKALEKRLIHLCMKLLADRKSEIAISAFAMQFVADRVAQYPSVREELILCLQTGLFGGSTGYCNRARKVLRQIGADTTS
ncbi:MAG: hypothetical protein KDB03_18960 [Planctomycetales bacterium]|nr:hypothetical protein [Planctomycetales bacterium]